MKTLFTLALLGCILLSCSQEQEAEMKANPFAALSIDYFEIDTTITGFQCAGIGSNYIIFTEDGLFNTSSFRSNTIDIFIKPKMTHEKSAEVMSTLIEQFSDGGMGIQTTEIQSIQIGKYPATVLQTQIEYKNQAGVFYIALLNGEKNSVLFAGKAFTDVPEMTEKYIETVKTIRIQ